MPRRPDSGQIDLAEIFRRVQQEMLAQLSVGRLFEHASTAGAATEHHCDVPPSSVQHRNRI